MDELERTENRFRPYRTRMYELLRQDPEYASASDQQNDQMMITRVTSVMHTLSHVQHALSDAVINLGQSRPRHLRARPLMIQSRVQSTVIPNSINIGGIRTSSASRVPPSASNSTSTATSTATTTASAAAPSNSSEASGTAASGLGALEGQLAGAFGEVEVSVEPIIVGIEVDSGIPLSSLGIPIPGGVGGGPSRNQTGSGATTGTNGGGQPMNNPQNLINPIMNAIIMNAARAQGLTASSVSSATTSTSSTASSSTSDTFQSSGQDSQARGAGPQTQPTTSTQTRSSTHVDYVAGRVPRRTIRHRQFGMPQLSAGPSFDPLLPCRLILIYYYTRWKFNDILKLNFGECQFWQF